MRVVIIEDEIIEAILESNVIHILIDTDRNVVILVFVSEVKGYHLCTWRDAGFDLFEEGFGHRFFH
jgi:hypothetical protein